MFQQVADPATGETRTDIIIRTADHANIPADERNVDWQDYLTWVAKGNQPDAPPTPELDQPK